MKETRNIKQIHNWDKNPRNINKKDFERLKAQITKLGQYKPLLITDDGTVLGGNMRLRAYKDLGITDIWVSVVKADTEEKKLEYALSDNDRAGYYDSDMLANMIPNYPEFDWSQYAVDLKEPQSLQDLIDSLSPVEEDDVPTLSTDPAISKLGEVYQLGRHRLMCGDATNIGDVENLMDGQKADMVFTDPPYGINLDSSYKGFPSDWENQKLEHKFESSIKGDDKPFDAKFIFDLGCKEVFLFGADYYANTLPDSGVNGTWYVWDKREEENYDKMLGSPFELCWGMQKRGKKIIRMRWASFLHGKATEGEQSKNRLHPTQKPLALCSYFVKEFSKRDDIVLDLFGGSGSTLIAAEQTNRTCFMAEISPVYCDVIRKRYNNFIDRNNEKG